MAQVITEESSFEIIMLDKISVGMNVIKNQAKCSMIKLYV